MLKFISKPTGKKVLLFTIILLALLILPAIILFITGKHRLLMKPQQARPHNMAVKGVVADDSGMPAKADADTLESIVQMYTVDFFAGHIEYAGSTDGNSSVSAGRTVLLPAVEIPDSIRLIAGLQEEKGYVARLSAVNALGTGLSKMEVTALLYFLHKKIADDNLEPLELDAVKNDAVIALMRQSRIPGELAPHLISMYHDRTFDNTWRDYCIQFMGQCYDNVYFPSMQQHIRKSLDAALKDQENIPAAAIIAMAGLVGRPGFSREEVSAAAFRLCSDSSTPDTVKTAALQICAKFKNRDILPPARRIVSSSAGVPLKISAVAAIGTFGEPADRELLETLSSSGDIRMRTAAKAALKKIRT